MKSEEKRRYRIAITLGDAAGIGPEITVKALGHSQLYESCIPVVVGDRAPLEDALKFTKSNLQIREIEDPIDAEGKYGVIDLIDLHLLSPGDWTYNQVCVSSGEAAFQYIAKSISLAMKRKVSAVATGPINKEAINIAGHHYSGHTEIFSAYTDTKDFGMLLMAGTLRTMHVTTHVSMRNACDIIRNHPERVETTIRLAHEAMLQLGIEHPRIGVAGLNAHCSENGLFGDEEELSIIPAINACIQQGMDVYGPIPPDTVFVKAIAGMYDVVVSMYHDQGHIPLKLTGFKLNAKTGEFDSLTGINTTIGLPIIRTSVDHGTAFGKACKNIANEKSLVDAIQMAVIMAKSRFPYEAV